MGLAALSFSSVSIPVKHRRQMGLSICIQHFKQQKMQWGCSWRKKRVLFSFFMCEAVCVYISVLEEQSALYMYLYPLECLRRHAENSSQSTQIQQGQIKPRKEAELRFLTEVCVCFFFLFPSKGRSFQQLQNETRLSGSQSIRTPTSIFALPFLLLRIKLIICGG